MDYYNERGRKIQRMLEEKKNKTYSAKAYQLAMNNTKYNQEGKAVVELDDEWREETEWDILGRM